MLNKYTIINNEHISPQKPWFYDMKQMWDGFPKMVCQYYDMKRLPLLSLLSLYLRFFFLIYAHLFITKVQKVMSLQF